MKKILYSTEFSKQAPEVFKFAAELAYFFKARLVILHAFNQPEVKVLTSAELEKMADDTSSRLLEFVETHLPEACRDIKIEYVTKSGFASNAIIETALEEHIELIVMGMTGRTNALNKLLGSTSLEVMKKADCPVLLIPPDARFQGIDNLVYTTNFEFRDLRAIQHLKKWSQAFEATIHCLHINEDREDQFQATKDMSILKTIYKRHQRIQFDMREGDFQRDIEAFAKSKSADIVAMMYHKRSLISGLLNRSEVEGIVSRIRIPLLVIKDNAYEMESDVADWIEIVNSIG